MSLQIFLKAVFLVLLLSLLVSCTQTIESKPFFEGNFTGEYFRPDDTDLSNPLPIRLETNVKEVSTKRYTVEGTVTLEGTTYSLSGLEDAGDHLEYITPQVAPISGFFTLAAKQGETVVYTLEGDILYGEVGLYASPRTPELQHMRICRGAVCSEETIIGKVRRLTKADRE